MLLTEREQQVLEQLVLGRAALECAHRRQVFRKMAVRNAVELTRKVMSENVGPKPTA